jgi:hypothetical protein
MATLVTRQVTLKEKNDSGPFYNVFYSVDNGNTYFESPDGEGVYLPSVGSSVNVKVASTTTTIKLVSTGQCTNELPSGSISTTSSTSTTTTVLIYNVGFRTSSGGPTSTTGCGTADTILYSNKSSFGQVGAGNNTIIYTNTSGTRLTGGNTWFGITQTQGPSTGTILVDNTGLVTDDNPTACTVTTTTCVPSSELDPIVCGYDAGSSTTACDHTNIVTAYKTGLWLDPPTLVYSSADGCNITPGFYSPLDGEEGEGSVFNVNQFGEVVGSGNCVTSTTTAPPIYSVGFRTSGGAPIAAFSCGTSDVILYSNKSSYAQVGAGNGTRIYTDTQGTPLQGGDTWFGIAPSSGPSQDSILINNSGYVTNDSPGQCTTTTTQAPPTVYNTGFRTTSGSPISGFACNDTTSPILYTSVSSFASIGVGTTIYTGTSGIPLTGGNTWYGISTSAGNPDKSILINNSGVVTDDFTCPPPLVLTQVWSDTQPRYGNLNSCGCTGETGVYNYSILGNYSIYSDLTGKTIYQDNVGNDLFVGDNLWYCLTDSEGSQTTISIRIDNLGNITGWVDCSTTSTTTTSSTTTTTTSATGCYEYLVECLSQGGCQVNYTDCNGVFQSFSQPYDTGGVICARPTPTVSGGIVEFLGDCELTTTTTQATTTTTTEAPLKKWNGSSDYTTSSDACQFGPNEFPTGYLHNGLSTYPRLGDVVYDRQENTLPAGWYWILNDNKSIEVNSSGVVIDLIECSNGGNQL